jgi:hypothetical protein
VAPTTPADLAKSQIRQRLEEVIAERERQKITAKWNARTSHALTFGQYIIGATLTASITQTAFSKTSLSIFGLVVIICSAAKQQFHPDETAKESTQTARRLNALVRYAQDQITVPKSRASKARTEQTHSFHF